MYEIGQIPVFTLFGETTVFPDVIHCERVFERAGLHDWVITPHRHGQMSQVFHIERGSARVMLDGEAGQLNSGEYLYVPPRAVHGFKFSKGTEGVVLSLPSPVLSRLGPQTAALTAWLSVPQRGAVSPMVAQFIGALAEAYASSGTFRAQRLVSLAHLVLAGLAEESLADSQQITDPGRQMQRLNALISEHMGAGWRARDYASALHITTGHLNRIVRSATGETVTAYLETAIMTEACRYLAFTRLSVAEVGHRLGYADPPYFSRRFRARIGETPTAYRGRVADG